MWRRTKVVAASSVGLQRRVHGFSLLDAKHSPSYSAKAGYPVRWDAAIEPTGTGYWIVRSRTMTLSVRWCFIP